MTGILRVYDPAECDAAGVPLDWLMCRPCKGSGEMVENLTPGVDPRDPAAEHVERVCPRCEGYGSLLAAAQAHFRREAVYRLPDPPIAGRELERRAGEVVLRCSACRHPMSKGEWLYEHEWTDDEFPVGLARKGLEFLGTVHASACDAGCQHGGPVRFRLQGTKEWGHLSSRQFDGADVGDMRSFVNPWRRVGIMLVGERDHSVYEAEAAWRAVDVRPLGWAHDLRSEKLDVLCLRCWTEEKPTDAR